MASEPYQGRKKNCHQNLNRINSLPKNAINKILGLLPTREAVATGTLSKFWRKKWRFMTELVFAEDSAIQGETFDQRTKFISYMLLLHKGNITKFGIRKFLHHAPADLGPWLTVLARPNHKLSHLELQFHSPTLYKLPSSLFDCQHLTTLILDYCTLQLPARTDPYTGFKNLTTLALYNVIASNETIEFVVNNNPLLEKLIVTLPWRLDLSHLRLNSPNLQICEIRGKCEHIAFVRTSELRAATIILSLQKHSTRSILDILGGLTNTREATFRHPFIQVFSIDTFREELTTTYNHLEHVRLEIDFEDPFQIMSIFWLFRSSPSLKRIDIVQVGRFNQGIRKWEISLDDVYEILDMKETILGSLETLNFQFFWGSRNEMRFIQFVLLNAGLLQNLIIRWIQNDPRVLVRERAAFRELCLFQRISSLVKVDIDFVNPTLAPCAPTVQWFT